MGTGQDIGTLIAQLGGLAGVGLGLSDVSGQRGRQRTLEARGDVAYGQLQQLFQKLMGLADQQQQRLDQYYTQQQQAYGQQEQQRDYDRYWQNAGYQRQLAETDYDRNVRNFVEGSKNQLALRLADPAQVQAGVNQMAQQTSQDATDAILRRISGSAATQGLTGGGATQGAIAEAYAPYVREDQQRAFQNYLAAQQGAISGLSYGPGGSYATGNAPVNPNAYTGAPPRPADRAQYPTPSDYLGYQGNIGGQDMSGLLQALSSIIGGTGGGPGIAASIGNLIKQLSGGGGSGGSVTPGGDSIAAGGTDPMTHQEVPESSWSTYDPTTFNTGDVPYDWGPTGFE